MSDDSKMEIDPPLTPEMRARLEEERKSWQGLGYEWRITNALNFLYGSGCIPRCYCVPEFGNARSGERVTLTETFAHEDWLWCTTAIAHGMGDNNRGNRTAWCYRLIPQDQWSGPLSDVKERSRADYYHGLPVSYKGAHFVLSGPCRVFVAHRVITPEEDQAPRTIERPADPNLFAQKPRDKRPGALARPQHASIANAVPSDPANANLFDDL